MAQHIVGVPKREPCKQCGLPVFFAERLAVDGSFYHRKCLRCARCESQLTPGSFYETEVDGVFCCETCPDEEKKLRLGANNNNSASVTGISERQSSRMADEHRQSFSEKLAMFQSNGKGLLQKSLSDEEKSKSLKRLTELYSKNCAHDANDITQTINESEDTQINRIEAVDDNDVDGESSTESSEGEDDEHDEPPLLPETLPPSLNATKTTTTTTTAIATDVRNEPPRIELPKPKLPPIPSKVNVLNKIYGRTGTETQRTSAIVPRPRSQIKSSTEPSIAVNDRESSQKHLDNCANEVHNPETKLSPAIAHDGEDDGITHTIENNLDASKRLPFDALHSFTNVTKENAADNEASQLQHTANVRLAEDNTVSHHTDNNDDDDDNSNINTEHGSDIKNAIQTESLELTIEAEHIECEQTVPNEEGETEWPDKHQEEQNDGNGCNENESVDTHFDKCATNQLDADTNLRERNSSINDNDSQKMVRSRLSQFEALVQSLEPKPHCSPKLNRSSVATLENISSDNVRKKSIQDDKMSNISDDAPQEMGQLNVELPQKIEVTHESIADAGDDDDDHRRENHVIPNSNTTADSDKILNIPEMNNLDMEKPVPRQRASINTCLDIDTKSAPSAVPTPSKRRQKPTAFSQTANEEQGESNLNSLESNGTSSPEITLRRRNEDQMKIEPKYPNGLNPFGSEDEEDLDEQKDRFDAIPKRKDSLNPFDSSDDEVELLKDAPKKKKTTNNHRISTNPFGSDSENETDIDSLSAIRTPVPTPRKQINGSSFQSTPDVSPRMAHTMHPNMRLRAGDDLRGSDASLASTSNYNRPSSTLNRSSQIHGSMSSLASTPRHKKGRAPSIPTTPKISASASSSPSQSMRATPISARKKRIAPLPPKLSNVKSETSSAPSYDIVPKLDESLSSQTTVSSESVVDLERSVDTAASTESNYVSSSNEMSISSTEPVTFLMADLSSDPRSANESIASKTSESSGAQRKLIRVDQSLLEDMINKSIGEMPADEKIIYRRKICADQIVSPFKSNSTEATLTDRQCEKMKENKESQNKNRQSQIGSTASVNVLDDSNQVFSPNKSSYGKWKRRKGPAPSLPIPPRKVIQMLPLQEIRHELEVIEVQQQGLEKQGVTLEKMIRERCEGTENENLPLSECKPNSKEVEDLILQLFELVNEKNELFRRQAELMYLRRQHRLEQEQADIEYEIRVLMAQPECNKTDSDKAREEALISRLVDVVQLRNEVIESLEMDRRREAEEDQSIKEQLELHTAKREEELCQQTPVKLSKKEKKKQKESKKLAKQKKMDADKDADESEINLSDKPKEKKKKKKFLFLHN